ncbi:MAG: 2,3-bisphosphoglycerate-independent phosphoglycerate mutase [Desulfobacterales bacterium]
MNFNRIRNLLQPADSKIVLLVMDGLGGLPKGLGHGTELETAKTPNLDDLAKQSLCGLHQPVGPAVTPGSGPAHLALFGYDPLEYEVGRGVLSALGIGFDLKSGDVAARGNFCTVDETGSVQDRRAGRISTDKNEVLCEKLRQVKVDGVRLFIQTVKEYRFLLVLRGEDLNGEIEDTDPQETGVQPLKPQARRPEARQTAKLVHRFVEAARKHLADERPANMVLLRGFSQKPQWPQLGEVFGLRAAAIAGYPMYRGVGKLIGMQVLETGESLSEELDTLEKRWDDFDFFYVHVKKIDSAGEDGDFDRKVSLIEEVDRHLPRLLELKPDVLIVTGDHSTPAVLRSHSWHPVPVLFHSAYCRPDHVGHFGERACMTGGLGPRFPAKDLMPLALANAGRLRKFGA